MDKHGKERLFALDILRGVAACLVLMRHLPLTIDHSLGWSEIAVDFVWRVGWCGVDLFFVLSGFLISSLLFKEYLRRGTLDLPRFWLRRGFKIWPCYFVAYGLLVATMLTDAFVKRDEAKATKTLKHAILNSVFVQNYFPESVHWPNSWSIAVEEHFYLALPLLLVAVMVWRRRRGATTFEETFKGLGFILLGVCLLVLLVRVGIAARGGTVEAIYHKTHLRLDALCFGVLLGYLKLIRPNWVTNATRYWPVLLLLVPAALLVPMAYPLSQSTFTLSAGFTLLYVAFGGWVLLASVHPDFGTRGPRVLVVPAKAMAFIGVYSYTIYLFHSVVYKLPGIRSLRALLMSYMDEAPLLVTWLDRILFWSLSIGGGVLLAKLVEKPFLRLRERWCPGTRTTAAKVPMRIAVTTRTGRESPIPC